MLNLDNLNLDILKEYLDPIETCGLVKRDNYGKELNASDKFIFISNKKNSITVSYNEYLIKLRNLKIDSIIHI